MPQIGERLFISAASSRLPPAEGVLQARHHPSQPALSATTVRSQLGPDFLANGSTGQTTMVDLDEEPVYRDDVLAFRNSTSRAFG